MTIWKGATFRQRILIYEDDGVTIRNLTGYTGQCLIQSATGATLKTMTNLNGGILLGGTTGILQLVIPADETALITWKSALYSLNIQGGVNSDIDPILYGNVVVRSVL